MFEGTQGERWVKVLEIVSISLIKLGDEMQKDNCELLAGGIFSCVILIQHMLEQAKLAKIEMINESKKNDNT